MQSIGVFRDGGRRPPMPPSPTRGEGFFLAIRFSYVISIFYPSRKSEVCARLHIGNKIGAIEAGQTRGSYSAKLTRQRRLALPGEDQISTCSAMARASSTSIPR